MKFWRLHIPTNTRSEGFWGDTYYSVGEFYRVLDRWNNQQPGVWQYGSV